MGARVALLTCTVIQLQIPQKVYLSCLKHPAYKDGGLVTPFMYWEQFWSNSKVTHSSTIALK